MICCSTVSHHGFASHSDVECYDGACCSDAPGFLEPTIFAGCYEKGLAAESQAADFLESEGYEILSRRVRTKHGEIDIIAKRGLDVVAVEVKHRKSMSNALQCISSKQKSRISNSFLSIVSKRNEIFENYRIDVICLDPSGTIEHIENAFGIEEFSSF